MLRDVLLALGLAATAVIAIAQSNGPSSASGHGWTVTADAKLEEIRIDRDGLGTVMDHVRLFRAQQVPERPFINGHQAARPATSSPSKPRNRTRSGGSTSTTTPSPSPPLRMMPSSPPRCPLPKTGNPPA